MNVVYSHLKIIYICPRCRRRLQVNYPQVLESVENISKRIEKRVCHICNKSVNMEILKVESRLDLNTKIINLKLICKSCGETWAEPIILTNKYKLSNIKENIQNKHCINTDCNKKNVVLKSSIIKSKQECIIG